MAIAETNLTITTIVAITMATIRKTITTVVSDSQLNDYAEKSNGNTRSVSASTAMLIRFRMICPVERIHAAS